MPYATFAFNSVGLPNESLFPQMSVRYHEVRNLETFLRMYKFTRSASRKIGNKPGVEKGIWVWQDREGTGEWTSKGTSIPSFPFSPSIALLFLPLRLNGNNTNVYSEKCGLYRVLD